MFRINQYIRLRRRISIRLLRVHGIINNMFTPGPRGFSNFGQRMIFTIGNKKKFKRDDP